MKLSKITIGLGVYIVVSSTFMLQVRNWLFRTFGNSIIINSFRLCFIFIFILTIVYAFKIHISLPRTFLEKVWGLFKICAIFSIFVLSYLLIMRQEYFSEKAHVLTYGLLGYLAANDLIDTERTLQLKNIALTISFIVLISALDEISQAILPYRFCELKDFITNIISGALGIGLLFGLKKRNKLIPERLG